MRKIKKREKPDFKMLMEPKKHPFGNKEIFTFG